MLFDALPREPSNPPPAQYRLLFARPRIGSQNAGNRVVGRIIFQDVRLHAIHEFEYLAPELSADTFLCEAGSMRLELLVHAQIRA
mgnify:FL=1